MSAKKLYPDPFIPADRTSYCFWFWNERLQKRQLKSTGFKKGRKEAARQFVRDFIDDLHAEKSATELTFQEYSEPFFKWEECPRVRRRLNEGKSIGKLHVRNSRSWLENYVFKDPVFPHLKMNEIRPHHILDLRERLKKITGTNTVNKTIISVKTIISEAYFREEIDRDPGHKIGILNYEQKEKGVLTPEQIKAWFLDETIWANRLSYTVFRFTAFTGMRSGEVRALRWNNVDLDSGEVRIYQALKNVHEIGAPKWNKKREILISSSTIQLLQDWKDYTLHQNDNDFVFCGNDGNSLGATWWKKNFNQSIEKVIQDRDQKNITPHSLRHSLNSNLLAAGCDPILIQKYLGWTNNHAKILVPVQDGYTHIQMNPLLILAAEIDSIYL